MLDESIAREWSRARRERHALAMLMCDIDHFKACNDRYGHSAGDACLARIAAILRDGVRIGIGRSPATGSRAAS